MNTLYNIYYRDIIMVKRALMNQKAAPKQEGLGL